MEHQKTHKRTDEEILDEFRCTHYDDDPNMSPCGQLGDGHGDMDLDDLIDILKERPFAQHPHQQSIEDEEIIKEFYRKFTRNCDGSEAPPIKCPHLKTDDDANAIANYLRTILATKTTAYDQRVREAVEAALWSVYDDGHISPRYIEEKLQALTKIESALKELK